MKILLYSHCFYPSIGGIENVSYKLASSFIKEGMECKVVTKSNTTTPDSFTFFVFRNPAYKEIIKIVAWADVILYNGASLGLQPWPVIFFKPFIWIHAGYQVSCVDGLGWINGKRAPITPLKSVVFHFKNFGFRAGMEGSLKLIIKRIFAKYLVKKNIAITQWMYQKQKLPRQVQIYNPFPIENFTNNKRISSEFDFLYLGRIVSEKGIETLLRAFEIVQKLNNFSSSLLIIGEGNWRSKMEKLAGDLQILSFVTFAGKKSGRELSEFVSKGKIAVIPSEWYEPMGGVVLELMAAGKNLIVSEKGGLKECVGEAGVTFPNGNYSILAEQMDRFLKDESLRMEQLEKFKVILQNFHPSKFIAQYINLLNSSIITPSR